MNLAIIEQLDLLQRLFGKIVVPEEVWRELTVEGRGKQWSETIIRAPWIERSSVNNVGLFQLLKKDLDIGEAAAIALAIEKNASLILLDETDARNVAEIYDLPKTGVIGVIMRAKERQLIKQVKPLLDALRIEAHFWIKQQLYETILLKAGEQ